MLTSSFQILTWVYLRTKLTKKLNLNLTEEEDSSQWSKSLSQVTVKKTKMDWQRFETFAKKKTRDSFDNGNKLKLTFSSFFAICGFSFFKDEREKDESDAKPDTESSYRVYLQTHSDLGFDRRNFINMVHLHFDFHFQWKAFVLSYYVSQ